MGHFGGPNQSEKRQFIDASKGMYMWTCMGLYVCMDPPRMDLLYMDILFKDLLVEVKEQAELSESHLPGPSTRIVVGLSGRRFSGRAR